MSIQLRFNILSNLVICTFEMDRNMEKCPLIQSHRAAQQPSVDGHNRQQMMEPLTTRRPQHQKDADSDGSDTRQVVPWTTPSAERCQHVL